MKNTIRSILSYISKLIIILAKKRALIIVILITYLTSIKVIRVFLLKLFFPTPTFGIYIQITVHIILKSNFTDKNDTQFKRFLSLNLDNSAQTWKFTLLWPLWLEYHGQLIFSMFDYAQPKVIVIQVRCEFV